VHACACACVSAHSHVAVGEEVDAEAVHAPFDVLPAVALAVREREYAFAVLVTRRPIPSVPKTPRRHNHKKQKLKRCTFETKVRQLSEWGNLPAND